MNPTELHYGTFLGLAPAECSYAESRVVVVPVPYDATVSYRGGARLGPGAILEASCQIELWDNELACEPAACGIHTAAAIAPTVEGPESMITRIEHSSRGHVDAGKFVATIGGEHSVTIGAARASAAHHDELSFLQIDAHPDLRDSYEGSRYSHACVGRRLAEIGPLVQVGVRTACREEIDFARQRPELHQVSGEEIFELPRRQWIERALSKLSQKVYVTLDVDGLDPAVIAATGTPVPGGLNWYDTLALLRAVADQRDVVGCDLVELAPAPGQHASDYAAAQLLYKMIAYFVRG